MTYVLAVDKWNGNNIIVFFIEPFQHGITVTTSRLLYWHHDDRLSVVSEDM